MAETDTDRPDKPARRSFLSFAAAAPAALVLPDTGAIESNVKTDFQRQVTPLLARGTAPRLGIGDLWYDWKAMLDSPLSAATNSDVVQNINRLRHLSFAWGDVRKSPYRSTTIGEITSPQWDAFEQEWLPILYPDKPGVIQEFSQARCTLGAELKNYGFDTDTTLSDAADAFREQCIQAAQAMMRQAYQRDPLGFIDRFHADGANMGLQLHYSYDPTKGYKDVVDWVPPDIAKHIEALFPFSGWGEKRSEAPTGLMNRFFALGSDETGNQLFHLALSLPQAKQALALILGAETTNKLHFEEPQAGGVIIILSPEQCEEIGDQIVALLPDKSPSEAMGVPLPIINEREKVPARANPPEVGKS